MRERKLRHRGGVSLQRRAPEKSNVYLERLLSKKFPGKGDRFLQNRIQAKVCAQGYTLVTLMIGCEVVVVEDADVEDGVVGADAHVADGQERDHLDRPVAVVTLTSLCQDRYWHKLQIRMED